MLSGQGKTTLTVHLCIRSGIRSRENDVNIVFYIIQRSLCENNLQLCPILILNYIFVVANMVLASSEEPGTPIFFVKQGPGTRGKLYKTTNKHYLQLQNDLL